MADVVDLMAAMEDAADMVEAWEQAWEAVTSLSSTSPTFVMTSLTTENLTDSKLQLPFGVGWQDLKDLFRQAGKHIRTPSNLKRHSTDYVQ